MDLLRKGLEKLELAAPASHDTSVTDEIVAAICQRISVIDCIIRARRA